MVAGVVVAAIPEDEHLGEPDFTSQYPTVNALLNNWPLLTAQSVTVEDVPDDVRSLIESITLDDLFRREVWPRLSFFALVRPNDDILPVRAVYNGETQNIGINRLTSGEPIWFAGPDVIASKVCPANRHTSCERFAGSARHADRPQAHIASRDGADRPATP